MPGAAGEGEQSTRRVLSWLQGTALGKPSPPGVGVGTHPCKSITAALWASSSPPLVAPQRLWGASRVSAEPSGHHPCRQGANPEVSSLALAGARRGATSDGCPEGGKPRTGSAGERAPVPAPSPFSTCVTAFPLPTQGPKNTWAPPHLSMESKIYRLFTADFTFNFPLSHSPKVIALLCACIFLFAGGVGAEPLLPPLMNGLRPSLQPQDVGITPPLRCRRWSPSP